MGLVAGRYTLGQLLGSGSYASVYRAYDGVSARDVAVKVFPGALGGEELERFRSEALALSRLRSRHVARVFDFGRDEDVGLFLVMEFIDGVHLDPQSIGRPLLPHEVLRVARGVLDALSDAHAAGIVHRDVKPSNVLLPRGRRALDEPRVLDFGIARTARRAEIDAAVGKHDAPEGTTLGTRRYMAPEQLARGAAGPESDVYSAGLVLFELLGAGPLFAGETLKEQLAARLSRDADVSSRIAAPLGLLLSRMLARDPKARFKSAEEALEAVGDLETAPVATTELFPKDAETGERPAVRESASRLRTSSPSIRVAPNFAFGGKRLCRLDPDGVVALRETLHALDISMTDALARRERGSDLGRIARAVALSLRLELDAASLLLEPLSEHSPLARAFGQALIAPRARKVTRARVEHDRTDMWIDAIDAELAAMLTALAAAMTTREDAARNETRCRRAHARLGDSSAAARTAKMAAVAMSCLLGGTPTSAGLAELSALRDSEKGPLTPFHTLVRALILGVAGFRGDEHLARQQLERASRIAVETGNTLLEARAIVGWGGMLVEIPSRIEQGVAILERATTLLAHGDAPSLEHVAEHNRGAALIIQGRYELAAQHLRRARVTAREELSAEHEMLACTNEAFAQIFLGDYEAATSALAELSEKRMVDISARGAAFAHVARSLYALVFVDLDRAFSELRRAHACAEEAEADGGDVTLLAELLGILYASGRGEPVDVLPRAAELEKLAQDHGFASFYWLENLRSAVGQIRHEEIRVRLEETLSRLVVLLGPITDAARDR